MCRGALLLGAIACAHAPAPTGDGAALDEPTLPVADMRWADLGPGLHRRRKFFRGLTGITHSCCRDSDAIATLLADTDTQCLETCWLTKSCLFASTRADSALSTDAEHARRQCTHCAGCRGVLTARAAESWPHIDQVHRSFQRLGRGGACSNRSGTPAWPCEPRSLRGGLNFKVHALPPRSFWETCVLQDRAETRFMAVGTGSCSDSAGDPVQLQRCGRVPLLADGGIAALDTRKPQPWALSRSACDGALSNGLIFVQRLNTKKEGLTNQFFEITHHLAVACEHNASFVSLGVSPDMSLDSRSTEQTASGSLAPAAVSLEQVLSVSRINRVLSELPFCASTRLLPSACLPHLLDGAPGDPRAFHCVDRFTHMFPAPLKKYGRHPRADELLRKAMRPVRSVLWTPEPAVELAPHSYLALHFNLDADWLVFMVDEMKFNRMSSSKLDAAERLAMLNECCLGAAGKPETRMARRWISRYSLAVEWTLQRQPREALMLRDGKPLLVVETQIKGDAITRWILDEFVAAVSHLVTIVLGHTTTSVRELNAAAEMDVALQSRAFIGLDKSSFSMLIAAALAAEGRVTCLLEVHGLSANTAAAQLYLSSAFNLTASMATGCNAWVHRRLQQTSNSTREHRRRHQRQRWRAPSLNCSDLVPQPVDVSPIRSPQAVHTALLAHLVGADIVEIGTRNGDGMECFAHVARSATAIELSKPYCEKLTLRASALQRRTGQSYNVSCRDYRDIVGEASAVDADYITWWEQAPHLVNHAVLRHLQSELMEGRLRPSARALMLFDLALDEDLQQWGILRVAADTREIVPFDERLDCARRIKPGHRHSALFETCSRANGTFGVAAFTIGRLEEAMLDRLQAASVASRARQKRHVKEHLARPG